MARRGALFGRDEELALLGRFLVGVASGRPASIVLEGAAGMGKSSLLDEVMTLASDTGFRVYAGRGDELTRDRPFGPVLDALAIDEHADDPRRVAIFDVLRPKPEQAASLLAMTVPEARFRVVEAVAALLAQDAEECPVLLIVDDAHWAEASTALALRAALRRAAGLPVGVVVASRPAVTHDSGVVTRALVDDGARHLELGALDEEAATALVTHLAAAPPGPRLSALVERAGGNPLFLTTLLDGLAREQRITIEHGLADVSSDEIPRSLSAEVLRTLSALGQDARGVLRLGAVMGSTFRATELADLGRLPPADLLAATEAALESGLLESRGDHLAFRHDLVREAIYNELPAAMRAAVHRELARALARLDAPAARVAAHFALGAEPGDHEAIQWIQRAASEAAGSAPSVAVTLFDQALGLDPTPDHRVDLLVRRIEALGLAGRLDEAQAAAADLAHVTRDSRQAADADRLLGLALLLRNQCAEASTALERAATHSSNRASVLSEAALAALGAADLSRAGALAQTALEAAGTTDPAGESTALCVLSRIASMTVDLAGAERLSAAAVEAADRDPGPEAHRHLPLLFHALSLHDLDRLDECERMTGEGRRMAEDAGMAFAAPLHHAITAFTHLRRGAIDLAAVEAEAGAAAVEDTGADVAAVWCLSLYAISAMHQGEMTAAARAVTRAMEFATSRPPLLGLDLFVLAGARLREASGDAGGALDQLLPTFEFLAASKAEKMAVVLAPDVVRLAMAQQRRDVAERGASVLRTVAERSALPAYEALALQARGVVEGDGSALIEAVGAARRSPRRMLLARCTESAASVAGGREAVGLLEEAVAIYDAAAATRDRARAAAALRAAGGRAPRSSTSARSGGREWDRLSPAEARVAHLVAAGLGNPEIAAQLFVSRRTIETHLRRIFAKLGLVSRVELALWTAKHAPRDE